MTTRKDVLRTLTVPVDRYGHRPEESTDLVAVEEPLEIQVRYPGDLPSTLAVVMRTPGDDLDLAVGFVTSERVVTYDEIADVQDAGIGRNRENIVAVTVKPDARVQLNTADRFGITSSACGVCGKTAVEVTGEHLGVTDEFNPKLTVEFLQSLPSLLEQHQPLFSSTGGSHGAALISSTGDVLHLREDVGRHIAFDKLIGAHYRSGATSFADTVAVLSSRASFELVQKSLVAGIPALVTIGPATSLAVQLATEHGLTLAGFTSSTRTIIYAGRARVHSEHRA